MNSRARILVGGWFNLASPLTAAFERVDVDQLGDSGDWSRPDLFAWSIELFEALCSASRDARSKEWSLLVVPLEYSDTLDSAEPDVAGLLSADWAQLEVPSLYLIEGAGTLGWDEAEEYRRVLKSIPIDTASTSYYRCWRTGTSEFARALYFVRHPD